MVLTIELAPELEARLKNRALANGFAEVTAYARKILEDETDKRRTLDQIFAPFQKQIEEQGVSDKEFDGLVTQARRDYFKDKNSQEK